METTVGRTGVKFGDTVPEIIPRFCGGTKVRQMIGMSVHTVGQIVIVDCPSFRSRISRQHVYRTRPGGCYICQWTFRERSC
jgi:hypothetical protein